MFHFVIFARLNRPKYRRREQHDEQGYISVQRYELFFNLVSFLALKMQKGGNFRVPQ